VWSDIHGPLNKHLTTLLNNTIKHSQFPNRLKEAQVVPLHKKKYPLGKKNYPPVSILVCVCWFEIKINVVLWSIFSDTVYARAVVFIKDNSFTNIICNIY
jgi:hypothetical protein